MGAKPETLHNIVGYDSKDLFQIIHLNPRTLGMATVSWNVASKRTGQNTDNYPVSRALRSVSQKFNYWFYFYSADRSNGDAPFARVTCPFSPDIATFYGMAWNKRISFEKCENHLNSASFDNGHKLLQASWQYFLNTTSKVIVTSQRLCCRWSIWGTFSLMHLPRVTMIVN